MHFGLEGSVSLPPRFALLKKKHALGTKRIVSYLLWCPVRASPRYFTLDDYLYEDSTDLAANMIGRSNARRGARRIFAVLQNRRLNQHIAYTVVDEVSQSKDSINSPVSTDCSPPDFFCALPRSCSSLMALLFILFPLQSCPIIFLNSKASMYYNYSLNSTHHRIPMLSITK